ncbi:protein of unknown function [uncultured Woeseiaceae bacterium]|uniref:Integrase catalytic domain-containing protein n=1 Tax=uncultured Woeseiaceae bacterium TaxID=1983305 RepID=A0A7D9H3S4_9GAMM|nr:protein of unknown function [uncultured Woeseiaceae bacterium]
MCEQSYLFGDQKGANAAKSSRRFHLCPNARADVVDYIEMFNNSKRRHGFNDLLSPVEYEKRFTERLASV